MKRFLLVPVLLILLMLLPPSRASAQVPDEGDTPVTIRVNGDVRVVPDETVETLVVVRGTALVEGTVTKLLLVVDGDAVVSGRVDGDLTMVRSDLELQPSAVVTDVNLIFSDLVRADGATVTGEVDEIAAWEGFSVGRGFFWFLWFSATVLVLVAGLLFAATGGRQLTEAATMIRSAPGPTLLATLLTWIVLPVAAVLAFITLVGIPVGFAILFVVMPALWFLGYIVAGTAVGLLVTRSVRSLPDQTEHPYAATLIGMVIAQVIVLIPVLGWLLVWLASLIGGGALVYRLFRAWRAPATAPAVAVAAS